MDRIDSGQAAAQSAPFAADSIYKIVGFNNPATCGYTDSYSTRGMIDREIEFFLEGTIAGAATKAAYTPAVIAWAQKFHNGLLPYFKEGPAGNETLILQARRAADLRPDPYLVRETPCLSRVSAIVARGTSLVTRLRGEENRLNVGIARFSTCATRAVTGAQFQQCRTTYVQSTLRPVLDALSLTGPLVTSFRVIADALRYIDAKCEGCTPVGDAQQPSADCMVIGGVAELCNPATFVCSKKSNTALRHTPRPYDDTASAWDYNDQVGDYCRGLGPVTQWQTCCASITEDGVSISLKRARPVSRYGDEPEECVVDPN